MLRALLLAVLGSLLAFVPAAATVCDLDETPAATLLLPYFEVTLGPTAGTDTILLLTNTGNVNVVAHVTLWSDLAVPVYAFPIGLPANDMVSISLRDVIVLGRLPDTDAAFPKAAFAGCNSVLPLPDIPPTQLTSLQNALSGQLAEAILGAGNCAGTPSPGLVRGYLTVDTVKECKAILPGYPGYFFESAAKPGIVTYQNVLTGLSYFTDPARPLGFAQPVVHLEADTKTPPTFKTGSYTFYARLVNWTAVDKREPLTTDFNVRFQVGSELVFQTDLFVWRDPKVNQKAFPCSTLPEWYRLRLPQNQIMVFNEAHRAERIGGRPFGAATQRVPVSEVAGPGLVIPDAIGNYGWLFMNLNHNALPSRSTTPAKQRPFAQAFVYCGVGVTYDTPYTGSYEATRLDKPCAPDYRMRKP